MQCIKKYKVQVKELVGFDYNPTAAFFIASVPNAVQDLELINHQGNVGLVTKYLDIWKYMYQHIRE